MKTALALAPTTPGVRPGIVDADELVPARLGRYLRPQGRGQTAAPDRRARGHGQGARQVAETIRRTLAALGIVHRGADGGLVMVSVGVATCMRPLADGDEALLAEADNRLYRAKAEGRNPLACRQ